MTKYFPVAENSEICLRAARIYEMRDKLRVAFEFSDREKFEAWVRIGRWIKTGRVMP